MGLQLNLGVRQRTGCRGRSDARAKHLASDYVGSLVAMRDFSAGSSSEARGAFVRRRIRRGLPYVAAGLGSLLIIHWLDGGSVRGLLVLFAVYAAGVAAFYVPVAIVCARLEWRWQQRLYDGEL